MPTIEPPWYIARNNHRLGPFAWTQVQQMAAGGMLQVTDMLLQNGAQKWHEVSDFLTAGSNGVILPNMVNTASPRQQLALWDYKQHLLTVLRKLPPKGFEQLCQRLLQASGFEEVEVTGCTGDGGIDGIGTLRVNAFVSLRVLFQCKRYKGTVGSPEVRNFRGAMQGRATRGVIMTTGGFTEDARQEANRDGVPPITLIGWEQLLQLFEELKLGLVPRTTYDVDVKFFRQFQNPT
jgi:HJR/Mrr/RecB family endonuclease